MRSPKKSASTTAASRWAEWAKPDTDRLLARKSAAPRLEPLFPIEAYTPHSRCPHKGPLKSDSFVCMICQGVSDSVQARIDRSYVQPPTDPDPEAWGAATTAHRPGPLRGGI